MDPDTPGVPRCASADAARRLGSRPVTRIRSRSKRPKSRASLPTPRADHAPRGQIFFP